MSQVRREAQEPTHPRWSSQPASLAYAPPGADAVVAAEIAVWEAAQVLEPLYEAPEQPQPD